MKERSWGSIMKEYTNSKESAAKSNLADSKYMLLSDLL